MLLTRSRHNKTSIGGGSGHGGGTPHSVPSSSEENKYNRHHHHGKSGSGSGGSNSNNNSNKSEKKCHFWSWILCGIVCSFLSIEYSIRSHKHLTTSSSSSPTLSDANGAGGPIITSDSILTPLKSLNMNLQSTTVESHLPSSYNQQYRYDSLANIKPDPNQHAILIPYRDRSFHLQLFLEYMGPYLHHHFPHAKFTLWIIEQDDQELFNRAWLANVGLREIVKSQPETSCVIFHDVDLVPNMTSHVPYTTCQYPTQLGSELQHFNWSVPYPAYCGGITSLSLRHWQLINGLGNDYIGWGGEDDDLYHRLRQNGLLITPTWSKDAAPIPRRPPKGRGVFRTISQRAEHHEQKKQHNNYWKTLELLREMHENSDRWKFDGMSDVYYTITSARTTHPEFGFSQYKHLKAMPQKLRDGSLQYHQTQAVEENANKPLAPLEFVHVPYTGGQAITKAASKAGYVWGACHYGQFQEWDCPSGISGDFQHAPMQFKASFQQAQRPWHIPLMRYLENPMEGTKRFTVVRHPYSRAISFYRYTYDQQHGYPHGFKYHSQVSDPNHPPLYIANYLREREHPDKLNVFLQEFLIREHHPHVPNGVELIPQVNYVYYRGLKYVHHVLHYEFLQRDFKNILEKYQMVDAITLPPPERKRKRKKQYVKKYDEKRIPKVTWTFWELLVQPLYTALGWSQSVAPPVVDMALAEIEDEYLLGAQDLTEETIAMLNTHFELDFKKFHYAKIKVNATAEAYWNPIQNIPRESAVAKQQADRNALLNKQKSGKPAQAQTVAQAAPKAPPTGQQQQGQAQQQAQQAPPPQGEPNSITTKQDTINTMMREGGPPPPPSSKDEDDAAANAQQQQGQRQYYNRDPMFRDRKKKLEERLNAKLQENAAAVAAANAAAKRQRQQQQSDGGDDSPNKKAKLTSAMKNMRAIADKLREKEDSDEERLAQATA